MLFSFVELHLTEHMEKDNSRCLPETTNYSKEDEKFMMMAIKLSEDNIDSGGGPFGAVIVRDGEVIATGTNRVVPFAECPQCLGTHEMLAFDRAVLIVELQLVIYEGIVKVDSLCVILGVAVAYPAYAGPIQSTQTHRTRFA